MKRMSEIVCHKVFLFLYARGSQKHKKSYQVGNIFKACLRRLTDQHGNNILGIEAESSNFTIYDYTATSNLPVPGPKVTVQFRP